MNTIICLLIVYAPFGDLFQMIVSEVARE